MWFLHLHYHDILHSYYYFGAVMTRPSRKILSFRRWSRDHLATRPYVLSSTVEVYQAGLNFTRHHSGDAPEPMAPRLSWLQIAVRGIFLAVAFYALLALIGAML